MPTQMKELTHGLGADAVWDCVGGTPFLKLSAACTRLGGTVTVLGTPYEQGFGLELSAMVFILQELTIAGVRGAGRRDQKLCMELLEAGKIRPVIDRSFPLASAAEAHAYLDSQRQIGKVLLLP
ncbi:zinc-binding dehydrogenase [Streptomyces sp. NPDC058464]|uniref:zinc-binding dehydrogenase n=1 Tax=Streptomyces sp. NPDC058464 TaxID=3346511 RepID=UPI00365655F7